MFIYVLRLLSGKYYVGKTNNPSRRFDEHVEGEGSKWTALFKPMEVIMIVPGDNFDEDKYVKKYMALYGIDNVRGGSYCRMELSGEEKALLTKEIRSSNNQCYHCGLGNHFASACKQVPPTKIEETKTYERRPRKTKKTRRIPNRKYLSCTKCGKKGHDKTTCYVKNVSDKEDSSSESFSEN